MEYTQKIIIIPVTEGPSEAITVTEAVGTGLAYYEQSFGYTIIALNCENHGVEQSCICKQERVAQLFIEELCKLTDWTQDKEIILSRMATSYAFVPGAIVGRIEDAYHAAGREYARELAQQPA